MYGLETKSPQELIAMTLAEVYLTAGFADDGEADKAAERIVAVLDMLGWKIERK